MTLAEANALDRAGFVAAFGGVFEHSPWVAESAWSARPFSSIAALHGAMVTVMRGATNAEQLALLRGHPELAGRAAVRGELTADSTKEQSGAGLMHCSPEEFARITELNTRYRERFGFPFIIAVKGHDRASILAEFTRRSALDPAQEFREALAQVAKITGFRLQALVTG
jgi:2-oxo-4-hydroxy-4-carboxy-5-ureidoimidazoline decarboxylase